MRHPKCLICGHKYMNHFIGTINLRDMCFMCSEFLNPESGHHKYIPDNLTYIEAKAKRRKLI